MTCLTKRFLFGVSIMKTNAILLALLVLLFGGCSNKHTYDNIQQNAKRECQRLPDSAKIECVEKHAESFESYTKSREELLRKHD